MLESQIGSIRASGLAPVYKKVTRFLPQPVQRGFKKCVRGILLRSQGAHEVHAKIRRPLVSLIVPVYNVESYLRQCLDSIIRQTYTNIEVILVNDGSTDTSPDIARSYVEKDHRFRLIEQANGGLSRARNAGVLAASGEYLAFIDSDDTIGAGYIQRAVSVLNETQSDFLVSSYSRFNSTREWKAARWIQAAHGVERLKATVSEFPGIMVNAMACSKVIRRSFWDQHALEFQPGILYEDQIFSARLYAKSASFDVLTEPYYQWRAREDKSSITQKVGDVADFQARLSAAKYSLSELSELSNQVSIVRAQQILANDFPMWLRQISQSSPAFWEAVAEGIAELAGEVPLDAWDQVNAQHRLLYQIVLNGSRDDALDYFRQGLWDLKNYSTYVKSGEVFLDSEAIDFDRFKVEESMRRLQEHQFPSICRFTRGLWLDDKLHVEGYAYIDHVDTKYADYAVELVLVSPDGKELMIPTKRRTVSLDEHVGNHPVNDYSEGGFEVDIDFRDILASKAFGKPESWNLELQLMTSGIARRIKSVPVMASSSLAIVGAKLIQNRSVNPTMSASRVISIRISEPTVTAAPAADGNAGSIVLRTKPGIELQAVAAITGGRRYFAPVRTRQLDTDDVETVFDLSDLGHLPRGAARIRAFDTKGKLRPITWSASHENAPQIQQRKLALSVHGNLELYEDRNVVEVRDVGFDNLGRLRLSIDAFTAGTASFGLVGGPEAIMLGTFSPGSQVVEVELYRAPGEALASGIYQVAAWSEDGRRITFRADPHLATPLPISAVSPSHRATVGLRRRSLIVRVSPSYKDSEIGAASQRKLKAKYVEVSENLRQSVLFRSYFGESASCNQLAIHKELRERGSKLELLWAVKDRSVAIPEGAIPVIRDSEDWYRSLATTKYYVDNMHQPEYMVKRDGQVIIQTFHGYPFKSMGLPHWESLHLDGHRVDSLLARAKDWDYLVSPAAYATPLLREHFGYQGKVLEYGYPRNDELVNDASAARRISIRRGLGIAADQNVALYAPTFRDADAINDYRSRMVSFLDVRRLSEELGPQWTVLVRGHAYHARQGVKLTNTDRIRNVSTHASINELMIASDIGIFDYSSIRFDYAALRKPMIFMVPDIDSYFRYRKPVVDFSATAPGPQVSSTEEVAATLMNAAETGFSLPPQYMEFVAGYTYLDDGTASRRVVDQIFGSPAAA
ncbi:CDP-glycerol glycerophosphotransferase family protein [Arthrobacter sp. I2-34]|uniref:CDP-glycerol glycerophosphotransferase family protein n=1 Tax=Arthrobacter hankyongi TaxID=2904801 RepID=A0ABS9L6Z4_9MICC|nr:CDP-glycerol glycerophosphotransferase family protein [Arthrobacter hankyongi]MCG2622267.1 CDP-glycerol glycerophosphotransferase family protein [Arthrobacter hankyongi]